MARVGIVRWFKAQGRVKTPDDEAALLPWYLNNTLSADEAGAVETWLRHDQAPATELAAWRQVQEVVADQSVVAPRLTAYQRVLDRVRAGPAPKPVPRLPRLAWGAAVGLAVLVLQWFVFQPGIVLDWSVQGDPVAAFRVYRAPLGTADFGLVGEVPVQAGVERYRYVDARPFSGVGYAYRVEAIGAEGQPVMSRSIATDLLDALPAQVAVVLTAVAAGCMAVLLGRAWPVCALASRKAMV